MLVLSRRAQQQIVVGDNVVITVLAVKGQTVRLGIEAPQEVRVIRREIEAKYAQRPKNDVCETPIGPAEGAIQTIVLAPLAARVSRRRDPSAKPGSRGPSAGPDKRGYRQASSGRRSHHELNICGSAVLEAVAGAQ